MYPPLHVSAEGYAPRNVFRIWSSLTIPGKSPFWCSRLTTEKKEFILGVGRYYIDPGMHTAEVAFAVRDDYQKRGIGTELLAYLTYLAKREGLLGFTAEVLAENRPMLHTFERVDLISKKRLLRGYAN